MRRSARACGERALTTQADGAKSTNQKSQKRGGATKVTFVFVLLGLVPIAPPDRSHVLVGVTEALAAERATWRRANFRLAEAPAGSEAPPLSLHVPCPDLLPSL